MPWEELDRGGFNQPNDEVTHVVRDVLVGDDLNDCLFDGQPGVNHLLVVVEQLDGQVFVGVRPAEQREAFLLFEVGKGERRVPLVLDIVPVEDEGLA